MSYYPLEILYHIFLTKKCRYLLLSIWICLSIWFFSQSILDAQNYFQTTTSYVTKLASKTIRSSVTEMEQVKKSEKVTDDISEVIRLRNEEQFVRNIESFGPITNETIVILIQVNMRKIYLQALIESLKNSRYIEETLLIFSHGSYDNDINTIVEDIKFTRVLQIFFPFSLQTHLNSFPGFSPGDCPYPPPKPGFAKKCFGKERDFKKLQVKHHWWWKVNFVFNHLRIMQYFQGLVLFLEEDHYVFPDILHVLRLMKEVSKTKCPDCNVFGVGRDPVRWGIHHFKGLTDQVSVQQWNNMGFAFTRDFWHGLNQPKCKDMFCEYNDYNWDFTLAYLSHKCLPAEIKPLTVIAPRVFHTGDCGLHHVTGSECTKSLNEIQDLQRLVTQYLFPSQLRATNTHYLQRKIDGRNLGWDDERDIQLCKEIADSQK